jgi:xylulokinase
VREPVVSDRPADESFALAVDLGTGGPKVGLVSLTGSIAWKDHVAVATSFLDGGGAVQDAAAWWTVVCDTARRALAESGVAPASVVAVSVTGQWASTIPVDEAGVPVGDCVLWMDTRGGRYTRQVIGGPVQGYHPVPLARWIRHTGGAPSTSGADPIGHMLYLENDELAVARAARWYLEPVDYLSMRFTGVAAATHASMTGAWLTDNRDLSRLEYDAALVRATGIPPAKLPPLRPTASVIGTVQPSVVEALGLDPDVEVKVVAGTPDLHSATVGAGAVRDYEAHLTISTTSWVSCPIPFKKTDPIRQVASVPGLSPDRYLVADNHETAGICLQWLRDNVLAPSDGLFGDGPAPSLSYEALTSLAAGAAAGSGNVLFAPWLAGNRSPVDDRNARAGFHNLSLQTTRADIVRSVLEGVAYHTRWLNEAVERFVGRKFGEMRLIGGGAASDLWCQIHADVLDRTIERVAEPLHANLKGAALLAGLALGKVAPDEVRGLVQLDGTFKPDRANRAVYDRLYAELPKLYKSQKPMFGRLNRRR